MLTGINYKNLRLNMLNLACIKEISILPYDIFPDAYIDTCIVILQLDNDSSDYYVNTRKMGKRDDVEFLKNLNYNKINVASWKNESNLKFILSSELISLQRIKTDPNFINLGSLTRIERGVQLYDRKKHTQSQINNDFLRIQNHLLVSNQTNLYPELLGEELSRYRLQPKKNTYIRYCDDLAGKRELTLFTTPRLVLRRLLSRRGELMSCYCSETLITTDNILNILILDSNISLKFLLGLLNSRLLSWIYTNSSTISVKDDFPQVTYEELKSLPIPKINFTTEGDRRQQGLETLINLYQIYQTNFDLMPILDQCQQHLNQDPEEADIIHDFLAYLAEQMLELNRQKQTEMKGFLEWLESFIGCPIANLKNKSKIQNYLGDYARQTTLDPALDLNGLIAILNQNKKLIKIDPNSRQDHTRLKT